MGSAAGTGRMALGAGTVHGIVDRNYVNMHQRLAMVYPDYMPAWGVREKSLFQIQQAIALIIFFQQFVVFEP